MNYGILFLREEAMIFFTFSGERKMLHKHVLEILARLEWIEEEKAGGSNQRHVVQADVHAMQADVHGFSEILTCYARIY